MPGTIMLSWFRNGWPDTITIAINSAIVLTASRRRKKGTRRTDRRHERPISCHEGSHANKLPYFEDIGLAAKVDTDVDNFLEANVYRQFHIIRIAEASGRIVLRRAF
jgi:hypothetical protein